MTVSPFPDELIEIKIKLEQLLNKKFNICLCNYYVHGKKSIGWHYDNEERGDINCIASLSFGVEREFSFRKIGSKEIYKSIVLHNGSLLVMGKGCQEHYQHALLADKQYTDPRLNLTFRLFDNNKYINH